MDSTEIKIIDRFLTSDLAQYVTSVLIGEKDQEDIPANGSISLLNLNGKHIGVTSYHIFDEYWKLSKGNNNIALQIHRTAIPNVNDRIIDCSKSLDLLTLDLDNIVTGCVINGINIGTTFYKPPC